MHTNCKICIVIPAYREATLENTLSSILQVAFDIRFEFEVIIHLNQPMNDTRNSTTEIHNKNESQIKALQNEGWPLFYARSTFKDSKKAGVGLARKIGMDAAAKRFCEIDRANGLIVCLDGDCLVQKNYLQVLLSFYSDSWLSPAASISYEHQIPMQGMASAIYQYELHLRYYIQLQRFLELPYAFHTVGSSMLVRAVNYAKQGGMNTRKAGEDFYFLHKFTHDENFTEINSTKVFPSGRASDRVPFGTGRAILNFSNEILSYDFRAAIDLKAFLDNLENIFLKKNWSWHEAKEDYSILVRSFFESIGFQDKYQELLYNTASFASFKKRFFQWFEAFKLMKYFHFSRDQYYPNKPVNYLAMEFLDHLEIPCEGDLLETYRKLDAGLM